MKRLVNIYHHMYQHKLLYLGLLIHLLFYVSAYWTRWLDFFFSGHSIHHCCRGLDFYQVPNGAYAYFHGGSLTGEMPAGMLAYGNGLPGNPNVYHPLFTLLLGSLLILFNAKASFYVWMFFKLFVTMLLMVYFYRSFRGSKYVAFAIFTMLINSTQYIEISISQFQFVLNCFLLLLLINLAKGGNKLLGSIFYLASLLVKPLGLLWFPVLWFKQRYTIAVLGMILFLVDTVFFLVNHTGNYYMDNLLFNFSGGYHAGPVQIITLTAWLRYSTQLPDTVISMLRIGCLLIVLFLCSLRRVSIFKGFFLTMAFFLLFYDQVYEYHYTVLIPILGVCIVMCKEFQTRVARAMIGIICLPNAFFVLRILHIGFDDNAFLGPTVTTLGWQILVLSRIVPMFLLTFWVVKPDVRPVYESLKKLLLVVRRVNQELELFG